MHQRVIGAPVGLVPHVGGGKTEIDKAMAGERERYVVERLQQRADSGGTALARPCVQSGLMLEARLASCRKNRSRASRQASHKEMPPRVAARRRPSGRQAWQCDVDRECRVHGGTQRGESAGWREKPRNVAAAENELHFT